METRKVRLDSGRVINVPSTATDAEIDAMVEEANVEVEAQRPDRPMDQRVGTDSEQEEFDRYRPKLTDEYFGEDFGRSVDAAVMGAGEQIRSFQRGLSSLNPFQTDEQDAELDRQAGAAESFAQEVTGPATRSPRGSVSLRCRLPLWRFPVGCPLRWLTVRLKPRWITARGIMP